GRWAGPGSTPGLTTPTPVNGAQPSGFSPVHGASLWPGPGLTPGRPSPLSLGGPLCTALLSAPSRHPHRRRRQQHAGHVELLGVLIELRQVAAQQRLPLREELL